MNATPTSRPSSSFATPFSSSGVEVSLATIMDQFQLMHADFGSRLDHLSNETCQMNTRIGHVARCQSHISSSAPSPSLEPIEESSLDVGCDYDDDASDSETDDDEMTAS